MAPCDCTHLKLSCLSSAAVREEALPQDDCVSSCILATSAEPAAAELRRGGVLSGLRRAEHMERYLRSQNAGSTSAAAVCSTPAALAAAGCVCAPLDGLQLVIVPARRPPLLLVDGFDSVHQPARGPPWAPADLPCLRALCYYYTARAFYSASSAESSQHHPWAATASGPSTQILTVLSASSAPVANMHRVGWLPTCEAPQHLRPIADLGPALRCKPSRLVALVPLRRQSLDCCLLPQSQESKCNKLIGSVEVQ